MAALQEGGRGAGLITQEECRVCAHVRACKSALTGVREHLNVTLAIYLHSKVLFFQILSFKSAFKGVTEHLNLTLAIVALQGLHSSLLNFTQLYSTLLNFTQLYSTLLNFTLLLNVTFATYSHTYHFFFVGKKELGRGSNSAVLIREAFEAGVFVAGNVLLMCC
jgi:hypothetical protein